MFKTLKHITTGLFSGNLQVNVTSGKKVVVTKHKIVVDGETYDLEKDGVEKMELTISANIKELQIFTHNADIKGNAETVNVSMSETVNVTGNVGSLNCSMGDVDVTGDVGDIDSSMGDVNISGKVSGNVKASMGDVNINN